MANQRFNIQFDFQASMGPIQASVADLQKRLSGLSLPQNLATSFEKLFGRLETEMSQFEAMTKNGFNSMTDVNKAQAAFSRISKLMNQIGIEAGRVRGLDPNKLIPKEAQTRVEELKKKLGELQAQQAKKDSYAESIKKQNELIKKQQRALSDLETRRKALDADAKSLGGQKGAATKRRNEAQASLDEAIAKRDSLIASGVKANDPALSAAKKDIDTYTKAVRDAQAQIDTLSNKLNTNATQMRNNAASTEIAERELQDLRTKLAEMQSFQINPQGLLELRQELARLQGLNLDEIPQDLGQIQSLINGLNAGHLSEVTQEIRQMDSSLEEIDSSADNARNGLNGIVDTARNMNRAAQDVENLKNQVFQFFSLTNSVQLFKRAVTSALNTVKELDATMTEAAVVTEFSVGDMWEKLPVYSANAQKLGVSINGMYQATTLYYQQGLKTNEAMSLGVETMKMAKIAGMESAEATEAMTAALRGFNMELNETSAVKVNDVYSQLAAVTAADTEQIATAMSKTASIAASANMEFETTAALLAQIIETTQEAPETAGTAMKTIIARFSEVKSLKDSGQTTGQDSEGEAIDVNKIQTALRTVGISMEGFFNGTEGLDSVLLKLAEKWEGLDFKTQHYIATMAAGSRQQSRFIAMMSDYGRTTELVGEAQSSTGASQKQFEKTQDSLAAKLQRLSNAWDQFLMGLSNNEIIKGAVDFLTFVIEGVNKLTEALSGGNGLTKSLVSLMTVIGALKLGRNALGGIMGQAAGGLGIGSKGPMKETITETPGDNGSIVRTIVKEPVQQGEQVGAQAGQGFVAGFKRAVSADSKGMRLESMFTTGPAAQADKNLAPNGGIGGKLGEIRNNKIQRKHENRAANALKAQTISDKDQGKVNYLSAIADRNSGGIKNKQGGIDTLDVGAVSDVYDQVLNETGSVEQAVEAANAKVKELGGTFMDSGESSAMLAEQTNGLTLNMGALGGAAMGVGGALGLLASLFQSLGMEEEAEFVSVLAGAFMGLGTVMTTLSSIAPMLGMSFTTAGIQITTAGVTSQLAWWWVFLIIAAIGLLIVGVVALAKAAEENSLEGRMEAAAEATERAKQAAENAKNAYEDLLSAKEGYDELQDQLDGLTKGTTEWKKALMESNQQVLELLQTYPELAKYLDRGEHGQLTISDDGWNAVIKQQEQAVKNASVAVMSSQLAETRLQQEKSENNLQDKAFNAGIQKWVQAGDYGYYTTDTADLEAIKQAYSERGEELFKLKEDGSYSDALEQFAKSIGQSAEDIYKLSEALGTYNAELAASEDQALGQAEAMLMAGASAETSNYEYGEEVVQGMAKTVVATSEQTEKDIAGKLYSKYGASEAKNNEYFQQLMKENGLTDNDMTGDDVHDLEVLYAKMAGISKDDIADGLKGDKEALAKEIAKIQAGKDATAQVEKVRKNMENLDENTQRRYAMAMSGNASVATRSDAAAMANLDIEKYAQTMGYASAQEMAQAQGIQDVYNADGTLAKSAATILAEQVHNMHTNINEAFEELDTKAETLGVDINKSFLKQATAAQTDAFIDFAAQAKGAGANISSTFNRLMSNATEEQKQQILSMLGSFDFTQEGEAQQFLAYLEGIGINMPTDEAKFFVKELKKISTGFKEINAASMIETINSLLDLADGLEEKQASEGLTDEQKKSLTESGLAQEGDFVWTGQAWQYIEGPISDLIDAIRANTTEMAKENPQILKDQIEIGKKVENLFKGATESGNNITISGKTFDKASFEAGTIDETRVEDLRSIFGLDKSKTNAEIMTYYRQAMNNYKNLANNKNELDKVNNIIDVLESPMSMEYEDIGTKVITDTVMADPVRQRVLNNLYVYDGKDRFQARSIDGQISLGKAVSKEVLTGGPNEQQQKQLLGMAKTYGVSQATIDKFTSGMKASDVATRQAALSTLKNAIELKKQEKQYGKTLSSLQDVNKQYATVEKGMSGYEEAVNAYGEAMNLDMTDFSNWGFVVDNMDIIKSAAEGNIQSILTLNKLLAKEHGFTITADGNFDLYNSKVDMADQATQDFLETQYKAGAMRLVELTTTQKGQYLVPKADGGFEIKEVEVGQTIQVLQPADAPSIERSLDTSGATAEKPEPVDNPYDKYFNDLEEINDLLRERERLERRYQQLVRRGIQSVSEVRKGQQDQLVSLREENDMQRAMIANRTGQIQDSMNKSGVSKYAKVETNEYGDKSIRIDWKEIDKVYKSGNEKEIEKIEKFMDENQEWLDDIYDREGTIQENLDKEYEILQQGMDEYLSLEEQIKSAIEASAQKEIDRLSAIDQSINDTNSKLLESMQTQIDEQRQARENEKTEEELSDKQRRLAYLQQDTSGANALEIMQLQKELEEGQESYTDQLIDQKISELQKQNDKAAEQRQQQIDILNLQLQHYMNSGEVWQRVNELLDGAIQADGTVAADSELMTLLKEANNYDAMSEIGQMQWYKDLINTIATGFNWLSGEGAMSSMWEGKEIRFTTAGGETVYGTVGADGKVTTKEGQVYSNVRWNGGDNFSTDESFKAKESKPAVETPRLTEEIKKGVSKAIWNGGQGWGNGQERKNKLKEVFGENDIQARYVDKKIYSGKASDYSYEKMRMKFKGYKTGGLADFTGPAWLDGTKSKPEYILNADQTKAFFTLVDVLSGLQANTSKSSEKTGDNTYDIDINVESIGSDYDVEQLATTVKRLINEDARYRNNNAINLTR